MASMQPSVEEQIGYLFKVVQTALRGAMDAALGEVGISTPVYAALTALHQQPGMSKADLARRCFVRPQSMTRVLAAMTADDLIERRPHPGHGRVLQTRLTEHGVVVLARAEALVSALVEDMLAGTGQRERRAFLAMLERCRDQLA
jgi:DNA-binding MarR family transcriptional regulator